MENSPKKEDAASSKTPKLKTLRAIPGSTGKFLRTSHRDNVLFLASALSFDALLAAIPLALIFIAIIGFILRDQSTVNIQGILELMLPVTGTGENPMLRVEKTIEAIIASRGQLSLYGIPLFLLFSTRLFASIRIALNQILHIPVHRSFLKALAVDLMLAGITTVLFAAGSLVSVPVFEVGFIDVVLSRLLAVAFGIVLFFLVYTIAPDESIDWDTALLSAAVVAVGFEVAKTLFGVYLANVATLNQLISHANAVAVILFVVWIYYSMLIFLVGAEVAKIHSISKKNQRKRESRAVAGHVST